MRNLFKSQIAKLDKEIVKNLRFFSIIDENVRL